MIVKRRKAIESKHQPNPFFLGIDIELNISTVTRH